MDLGEFIELGEVDDPSSLETTVPEGREECDILLVETVAKFPVLYDKAETDYKNNTIRESCWLQISDVVKVLSAADCSKRWGQLRESFTREKRKREEESRSGSGSSQRRGFYLYESMKFLEGHINRRRALTNVSLSKHNATHAKRPRGSVTIRSVIHSPAESSVRQSEISLSQVKSILAALQARPSMTTIQTVPTSTMTLDVLTPSTAVLTSSEAHGVMSPPNSESDLTSLQTSPIPTMSALSNQNTAGASTDTSPSSILLSPRSTSTPPIFSQVPPTIISYNLPTPSLHHNYPSTNTRPSTLPPNTPTPPPSTSTPPPFFRASTPSYSVPHSPASSYYADTSPPYSLSQGDDSYDTTSDQTTINSLNRRARLHSERTLFSKIRNRESDVPLTSNLVETAACYNKELKKSKKVDPIESAVLSLSGTLTNHFANLEGKEKGKNESARTEQVNKQIPAVDQAFGTFIASEISNLPEPLKTKKKAHIVEVLLQTTD